MLRSGLRGLRLASVALAAALVATPASWSMPPTVLGPSPMLPGLSPGGLRLEHLTPAVLGLSVGQATAGVLPAAPQTPAASPEMLASLLLAAVMLASLLLAAPQAAVQVKGYKVWL